ncbi:hypothetical protein UPYG_G00079970, partial [Umbra pygmaea]
PPCILKVVQVGVASRRKKTLKCEVSMKQTCRLLIRYSRIDSRLPLYQAYAFRKARLCFILLFQAN